MTAGLPWGRRCLVDDGRAPGPPWSRSASRAGQPSGASRQTLDDVIRQSGSVPAGESVGLAGVHGQLGRAELQQRRPLRAPAGQRQVDRLATGDGHLGSGRQVRDELGERVEGGAIREPMRVIEGQQDRAPTSDDGRQQAPDHRTGADAASVDGSEDGRVQWLDAMEGRGQVAEEHARVVVEVVDRQPGRLARPVGGPLCEQRRLAVAGRRDDGDEPTVRFGPEASQDPAPRHRGLAYRSGRGAWPR